MKKMKADAAVIGCVLMVAILFLIIQNLPFHEAGEVHIMKEGQMIGNYSLTEDKTITVPWDEEGYNLVLISEGTVRVCDADCPDKLCIRQKEISKNGESIICLPHKLVVQIVSKEESDLDAVTN